jgi:hypothetical protein
LVTKRHKKHEEKLGAESGREIGVSENQVAGHQENRISGD